MCSCDISGLKPSVRSKEEERRAQSDGVLTTQSKDGGKEGCASEAEWSLVFVVGVLQL